VAAVTPALWLAGGRAGALILALAMIHLLVGIEAATFRRWSLVWRGWRDRGIVIGDDREAAERRFFDRYVVAETTREMELALAAARGPPSPLSPLSPPPASAPDVVGLFPQPGASPGASR
jgi:hypothetical protein